MQNRSKILGVQPKYYYVGDFNGDGKAEVLAISCHHFPKSNDQTIISRCYLFDLESGTILYEGHVFPYIVDFLNTGFYGPNMPIDSDKLFIIDYDGDGKDEICHVNESGVSIYQYVASTSRFEKITTYTGLKKADVKDRILLSADINGDGKPDILLSPKEKKFNPKEGLQDDYPDADHLWTVFYGKGNGSFEKNTFNGPYYMQVSYTPYILQDLNGDGAIDLLHIGRGIKSYLSKNGVWVDDGVSRILDPNYHYSFPANISMLGRVGQLATVTSNPRSKDITKYSYPRDDTKEKLLTGVVSSLGVVNKIYYERLDEFKHYTKGSGASFPYENFQGPLYVPVRISMYFNGQETDYQTYHYENAVIHKQGLGFRGFEKITGYDQRDNPTIKIFDPYKFGVLKSEESLVGKTAYTDSVSVASNKIAKIRIRGTTVLDKLNGTTVTTSYVYDTYGNPTSISIDYGGGITEFISNGYANNTTESGYRLGFLKDYTKVRRRNSDQVTERIYLADYTKGVPLLKRQYYNGYQVSSENFTYDTQGNCTQQGIQYYTSSDTLKTKYEYNNYGRLTKETDRFGLSKTYMYNANNGRLASTRNHKQQATTYDYGALGRVTSVSYQDGSKETTAYNWASGGTNGLYCVESTATGKPASKIYYDALGRETRSSITQFNGTQAHTDKLYDSYGRLEKVSLPFTVPSASYWNTYKYDSCDRITELSYASGKKDSYEYRHSAVRSTIDGIENTKIYDMSGQLHRASGILYNLWANDQPRSIRVMGDSTLFEYDVYGRQTAIIDPSAGRKSFTYDPAGNIKTQTDANGKITTMTYDRYNRLISKSCPEFTTTYEYNSENQLISETTTNDTKKIYTYNAYYGRLASEKENDTFEKVYSYSSGNLATKTYKIENKIVATENYTYSNGTLSEITLNNTTSIWKLNAVNAFGQPTKVTTGAITREYKYNAYGIPTGRKAHSFQDFTYDFAAARGNLSSRRDNIKGRPENFTYDSQNRLTSYSGTSAAYDANGNITRLGDMGSLAYTVSGKPYALSGITPIANAAVAAPNRNQEVTYTSFDRPASIGEAGSNASFTYNGSGERASMEISQRADMIMPLAAGIGGGDIFVHPITDILTRKYFLDCYETDFKIRNTGFMSRILGRKEKIYLGGDFYSAPAVFVKENDGNWNIYYICRDYLGSITHIANSSGSLVQELSYDAWGRLRNPQTEVVYAPGAEPELFLGRGYTGHEHLQPFGLINMNARLYDPAVGRFLSPDPYVQDPLHSQSYNRYSYCLNNPLKYTDPSGENPYFILAGFLLGKWYYDGYKANNGQLNPTKWTQQPNFVIGYSSQGKSVYFGSGWNDNMSIGFGYSFGSNALIGGYIQNGELHFGTFPTGTALVEEDPYGIIRPYEPNGWERFRDASILSRCAYNFLDVFWVYGTGSLGGYENARHLGGTSATRREFEEAGIFSILSLMPLGASGGIAAKGGAQYSDDLVKAAQTLYPNKAGVTELHHITPKYLGGSANGPLVPLNGSYHQVITNEFRSLWQYGKGIPNPTELQIIKNQVYFKYPLPPGYAY